MKNPLEKIWSRYDRAPELLRLLICLAVIVPWLIATNTGKGSVFLFVASSIALLLVLLSRMWHLHANARL
ncbi:MAG: hypothetical protein HYT22_00480 [Candidatus Niyogibacteria bacterium]|nr:hypothetical protein [Candidatus Niyogibacteria bacterium]